MYTKIEDLIIRRTRPSFYINERQSDFNQKYEAYNRAISKYQAQIEMVCQLLDIKERMQILEVGGGVGFDLFELANLGATCVDVDICPENAEFVKTCAKFYGLPVETLRGDTCLLPFKDEYFDAVYSKSTFEHIWDCDRALQEQVRVLKEGGRLLVIDGNFMNPKTFYNLFVRKFVKSKGKEGGLRWLLNKGRVFGHYGIGWRGKDEDVKTVRWWKRKMREFNDLDVIEITTTGVFKNPDNIIYKMFKPFVGGIVVLAMKRTTF